MAQTATPPESQEPGPIPSRGCKRRWIEWGISWRPILTNRLAERVHKILGEQSRENRNIQSVRRPFPQSKPEPVVSSAGYYFSKVSTNSSDLTSSSLYGGLSFEANHASTIPLTSPATWLSQEIGVELGKTPLSMPP